MLTNHVIRLQNVVDLICFIDVNSEKNEPYTEMYNTLPLNTPPSSSGQLRLTRLPLDSSELFLDTLPSKCLHS